MRSGEVLPHGSARPASVPAPLRIGIDFDNTIIGYDAVFLAAARERQLVGADMADTKQAIRDAIRLLPDGEISWQRLQGYVYGTGIRDAVLIDGVADFLRRCRAHGHTVYIVSHKTEFNRYDPDQVNLRHAALAWMEAQGLFGEPCGLLRSHVFFESTRADKLARIAALGCTHFIDDLEEVLTAPGFPAAVRRIMFSARAGKGMPFPVCPSWRTIAETIFDETELARASRVAAALIGRPTERIEPTGHGRNSRVFRVRAGSETFALKRYPPPQNDHHDRLAAEHEALRLFERHRVAAVPRVLAVDRAEGFALMSWLDGAAVDDIGDADIDAAIAFLAGVHALRHSTKYGRRAAEACLSGAEILAQIRRRLEALRAPAVADRDLGSFLDGSLAPVLQSTSARAAQALQRAGIDIAADLPRAGQTLAPSDFGFHNALRRPDGTLAFVDFEYFGWDDPVKLTADVLLHPGVPLPERQRARFRAAAVALYGAGDKGFAERLAALYPLFGLRWVLILLNEFLPVRWERRVAAGETGRWPDVKAGQLGKARALLTRIMQEESELLHA